MITNNSSALPCTLSLLLTLAGCADAAPSGAEPGDAGLLREPKVDEAEGGVPRANPDSGAAPAAETRWATVPGAEGASARTLARPGSHVLLVYGGCGADQASTEAWADALAYSEGWRGAWLAPAHLFAVRWTSAGCGYDGAFRNSVVGPMLLQRVGSQGSVTVVAHSSGAYVAHELLAQALGLRMPTWDKDRSLVGRLRYFNLDGGGDANLERLAQDGNLPTLFVGARDSASGLASRNHATMRALGGASSFFELDVRGSGCLTANCLHNTVITSVPHNLRSFVDDQGSSAPLRCDYSSFAARPNPACSGIDQQSSRAAERRVEARFLLR